MSEADIIREFFDDAENAEKLHGFVLPMSAPRADLDRLVNDQEILLPDDEVCACLSETGSRQVRIYERCERCRALMESDYPERLQAAEAEATRLRETLTAKNELLSAYRTGDRRKADRALGKLERLRADG